MDAATVSAFAAAGAALAAAAVAIIQLIVGLRQSRAALLSATAAMKTAESVGRHRVAVFRQTWINTIIETLSEYTAIVMATPATAERQPEERKKIGTLGTKLGLLLNPDEADALVLLQLTDEIGREDVVDSERVEKVRALVALAHKILKTEWVRIKAELQ
jgi:hypothetical protein